MTLTLAASLTQSGGNSNIKIKAEESVCSPMGYWHVSGPKYNNWINSVNILTQRHLVNHPLHDEILETCKRKNNPSTLKNIISYLETIVKDNEFWSMLTDQSKEDDEVETNVADTSHISKKVFIVHGHDNEAKLDVARTLEKAGFEAIILHEQHDNGLTIIQKIEKHTDVAFAVVL